MQYGFREIGVITSKIPDSQNSQIITRDTRHVRNTGYGIEERIDVRCQMSKDREKRGRKESRGHQI